MKSTMTWIAVGVLIALAALLICLAYWHPMRGSCER